MILGGSPISVAVHHKFEAIIMGIMNLTGFSSKIREIEIATGVIRNIVVTLSRNAESTAVIKKNEINKIIIFHLESSKSFTANHSKTCV